jgi:parallel beta-helix repeat protein
MGITCHQLIPIQKDETMHYNKVTRAGTSTLARFQKIIKNKYRHMKTYVSIFFIGLLAACTRPPEPIAWKSIEKDFQARLIMAADGDTVHIPEGHFLFTRTLSMDGKRQVVIKGAGPDKTILSFQNQEEGSEGLRITNSENILLEDFSVWDAAGDNIKVSDTRGITFRRIHSTWSGGPKTTNGAYGLYPVLCTRVLIEYCESSNASDAGIYVGQSDSVIIRHNLAYQNVAGIESENSRWVDIYENYTHNNTGGILVFDLPGLTQTGHSTRVYANKVEKNNHTNFAPKGNTVAAVPPGTGIMLLATRQLEMWDNDILHNRTVGTAIVSYVLVAALTAESEQEESNAGDAATLNQNYLLDKNYDPYVENIYIHHNRYKNNKWLPSTEHDIGKLLAVKFMMSTPDIVFDGLLPDHRELGICLFENGKATFAQLDAGNDFEDISQDMEPYTCQHPKISYTPFL